MPHELILNFHGLGEPPRWVTDGEREVWVPVDWLEAIIDAPLGDGVRLTFDDGNASDVHQALPVLTERGIAAQFFPLTGRIGHAGYLGAEDIAGLSAAGMGVGSHGVDHRDWRTLGADDLDDELVLSRRQLAGIVGAEITDAACPFGSYDRRVLRALRAAGYRRVLTSDGGTGRVGAWPSPRTTVDRRRPLQYWVQLAQAGASRRPGPALRGKRLLKRLR